MATSSLRLVNVDVWPAVSDCSLRLLLPSARSSSAKPDNPILRVSDRAAYRSSDNALAGIGK